METGLWVMYEIEYGEIKNVMKVPKRKPVDEYLTVQKRFAHLFKMSGGEEQIKLIQAQADRNAARYGIEGEGTD